MIICKTICSPEFRDKWVPRLLSVLRIMAGLLFMSHGTVKLLNFPAGSDHGSVELFSMMGYAGILELVGGGLLALGLFTRATAFILSGEMAFAYFIGHFPRGLFPVLNGGDAAVLYCFIFLYISVAGGGPWALDKLCCKNKSACCPVSGDKPEAS